MPYTRCHPNNVYRPSPLQDKYGNNAERKPNRSGEMSVARSRGGRVEAVQTLLKTVAALTAPRVVSDRRFLPAIAFAPLLRRGDALRPGRAGGQIYTCSTKAGRGETGCKGRTVPWESSTASWPSTSRTGCCSPASRTNPFTCARSPLDAPRQERAHRRMRKRAAERTPNSSGCTMPSKRIAECPIRCSRSGDRAEHSRPAPRRMQSGPRGALDALAEHHAQALKPFASRPAGACGSRRRLPP